jgi:hypothetical protein
MTCEAIRLQLDDYVDDQLSDPERRRIDTHLASCTICAALAADLTALRETARALGPIVPPDRVWTNLVNRIDLDTSGPAMPVAARARRSFRIWQVAAALAVVLTSVYIIEQVRSRPGGRSVTSLGNAAADDSVKTIEQDLREADRLYSDAIARLEAIVASEAGPVDAATVEPLRSSRAMLDRAIAESRAALEQDPTNVAARTSLFGALRQKVDVLQSTVALAGGAPPAVEDLAPAGGRKS